MLTLMARCALWVGLLVAATVSSAWARGIPLSVSLASRGYSPVVQERGVAVYRNKESKVADIAAEGVFPVTAARLQQVLIDYGRHVGRIARVKQSRVLERKPGALRVYQRLDLPVLSDRDFTLAVRWGQDGELRWVDFHTSRKGPPPSPGVVRLTHHRGSWELKPIKGGAATLARYQVSIDLGGYLPRWLARSRTGKEVPALFAALCGMAVGREQAGRLCR